MFNLYMSKNKSRNKQRNKQRNKSRKNAAGFGDEMPDYLDDGARDEFRQHHFFRILPDDEVSFHYAPLQGMPGGMFAGEILSLLSIRHLLMIIKSNQTAQTMSIGFYPKGGNILGGLITPKEGSLWSPDPHYVEGQRNSGPAVYYNTDDPIAYKIDELQADYINGILYSDDCKLKNGAKSRGAIKRNRIECPNKDFNYCVLRPGSKNKFCISWLYEVFPELYEDVHGTDEEQYESMVI